MNLSATSKFVVFWKLAVPATVKLPDTTAFLPILTSLTTVRSLSTVTSAAKLTAPEETENHLMRMKQYLC